MTILDLQIPLHRRQRRHRQKQDGQRGFDHPKRSGQKRDPSELENVIVEGKLYVYGGGEIELKDVVAPNMTVQRSSDGFHITATGNTKINNTVLKAHATLEEKRLADDAEGFMQ